MTRNGLDDGLDDGLDRILAALAERADGHVTGDRVAAVRRRARRATATRVSVTAAVVVALVIAVAAGTGGFPFARKAQPAEPPRPYLRVELTPADDIAAAMPPPTFGGINGVVNVRVRGTVPQLVPPAGEPIPEGRENLLGLSIDWRPGFGSGGNTGIEGATCAPDAPLVPIEDDFVVSAVYDRPGTYPVTVTYRACPPVGEVQQTITIEVKAPS